MTLAHREETRVYTRLLKCALELDEARAYWERRALEPSPSAQDAFQGYWFGAKSLARVEILLANMRARFDAFPDAMAVLGAWHDMSSDTRRAICHWHLQLSDPLYRAFAGAYLPARRASGRGSVSLDLVVSWVGQQEGSRWGMATRVQFASKLLSAARSAGLLATNRDPRPLTVPKVPDEALEYLLYLLRQTQFEGTLLDNPYLASVDLQGDLLHQRLRRLPSLAFQRQHQLTDFGWRYPDLRAWFEAQHGHAHAQEAV